MSYFNYGDEIRICDNSNEEMNAIIIRNPPNFWSRVKLAWKILRGIK